MKTFLCLLLFVVFPPFVVNAQSLQPSPLQQEWDAIRMRMYEKQDSLSTLYKSCSIRLAQTTDTVLRKELEEQAHRLSRAIEQNTDSCLQQEFELVKHHPSDPVSLDILAMEFNRREGQPYETFHQLLYSLSAILRSSKKGKQLQDDLFHCQNSAIGKPAPDFILKDIHQEPLSLSAWQNKHYILLDFWASWCVPCRKDFPFLKQIYAKYNSLGLEVLNISIDEDVDAWRKAITTDSIGLWKQVSVKENNSTVATQYFVTGVPVKVLIDKQGKIIARWRGSSKENEEAMRQVLQHIFE